MSAAASNYPSALSLGPSNAVIYCFSICLLETGNEVDMLDKAPQEQHVASKVHLVILHEEPHCTDALVRFISFPGRVARCSSPIH